jgi:hypothetical protein
MRFLEEVHRTAVAYLGPPLTWELPPEDLEVGESATVVGPVTTFASTEKIVNAGEMP